MPTAHFRVRNFITHWSNNMSIVKEDIRGGQRGSGRRVKLLDINQNNSKETAENNGRSQRKTGQRGGGSWANMGSAGEWGRWQEEERDAGSAGLVEPARSPTGSLLEHQKERPLRKKLGQSDIPESTVWRGEPALLSPDPTPIPRVPCVARTRSRREPCIGDFTALPIEPTAWRSFNNRRRLTLFH